LRHGHPVRRVRQLDPCEALVTSCALLRWWIACPLVAFSAAATTAALHPADVAGARARDGRHDQRDEIDSSTRRWLTAACRRGGRAVMACAAIVPSIAVDAPGLMWRAVPAIAAIAAGTSAFVVFHRQSRHSRARGALGGSSR
jgi:hypothetical protein